MVQISMSTCSGLERNPPQTSLTARPHPGGSTVVYTEANFDNGCYVYREFMANSKCVVLVRSKQLSWAPDTMTCKCNRTGTCKSCSCAKKNSRCTNCLPCRLNKCVNISSSSTDDIDNTPETQGDTEGPESVSEISDGGNDLINQQSPTNAHHDDQCKLPDPSPIANPSFSWGNFDSETIIALMKKAYNEVVH